MGCVSSFVSQALSTSFYWAVSSDNRRLNGNGRNKSQASQASQASQRMQVSIKNPASHSLHPSVEGGSHRNTAETTRHKYICTLRHHRHNISPKEGWFMDISYQATSTESFETMNRHHDGQGGQRTPYLALPRLYCSNQRKIANNTAVRIRPVSS